MPGMPRTPRYGPADSLQSPRFTGPTTFARLPHVTDLADVDLAVVGVPFDTGVTYRVGGRFGPGAVRDASVMLRPYNPHLDVSPFQVLSCVDHGDVAIVPGYIERSYAAAGRMASMRPPVTATSTRSAADPRGTAGSVCVGWTRALRTRRSTPGCSPSEAPVRRGAHAATVRAVYRRRGRVSGRWRTSPLRRPPTWSPVTGGHA